MGILKAGWHCGGNPAAAGTAADCPPCQICDGSTCVQACPVGGSSTAGSPGADGGLAAIFAAQCTCDDMNDCTINDRCDGSGGCTGDPVEVRSITGACVGGVGQAINLTADSNAPARVKWQAPGGNPATGMGGSFSVTYAAKGDKTVTAACGSSSKSRQVTVDDSCAGITPRLNEIETNQAPDAGATGQIRRIRHDATYKGCVDGSKWCFRLEEFLEEHAIGIATEAATGLTDISGPNDSDVTPATCALIISDLTPPPAGTAAPPPRTTYTSLMVTEVHERFHVSDFRNRVVTPTMNQLAAFVSQASNCTDCKTATPDATFDAEMERLWTANRPSYFDGNHEMRAYDHANPQYGALAQAVRQRARTAPASENWPAACK